MTKQNIPYPTRAEVTDGWTDAQWAQAVEDIKGTYYATSPSLAKLEAANVNTDVLHAWAYLAEALQELYPTAIVTGTEVRRPMTDEELRDAAASKAAADEYTRRTRAAEVTS